MNSIFRTLFFYTLAAVSAPLSLSHAAEVPGWAVFLPMEEGGAAAPEGFVYVEGGCFDMGDININGVKKEKRERYSHQHVHNVCVDEFYIGRYEVTQKFYESVMGSNPSYFNDCGDCPVGMVNWYDVQVFIKELRRKTGKGYRLPTEAEWEYAARSGGKAEKWAGTNDESKLPEYAWFRDNAGMRVHPVGQKKPNGLGLYDMSGNASEWVQDIYSNNYYFKSPRRNPKGPSEGDFRVQRGSGYTGDWLDLKLTDRSGHKGPSRGGGFRVVLPVKK